MTPGRRPLEYRSFDEVMPDVERLLEGHTTVGTWSLAQICRHSATILRRWIDLPASTLHDPAHRVTGDQKRQVFATGRLPEGLPGPPGVIPLEAGGEREEAEGLRLAIADFLASAGPVASHRLFGPLTRDEWHRLGLIHTAHHLSFASPA